MGIKKKFLLVLAIFILSGCPVQSADKCPGESVNRTTYCSGAFNTIVSQACSPTLKEAACANNYERDANSFAGALQCFAYDSNSISDTDGFRILFSEIPLDTIETALNVFTNEIPGLNGTSMEARAVLLRGIWDRLQSDATIMTNEFLTKWFQGILQPLLPAIPKDILKCMTLYPLFCDAMPTVVQALDKVYTTMDNAQRTTVASWITETLNLIGCTKKSSSAWICAFWKKFSRNANYSDFIRSWSGFNGYAAAKLMTAKQLAELTAKTNGLQELTKTQTIIQTLNDNNIDYVAEYMDNVSTLAEQMELELNRSLSNMILKAVVVRLDTSYPERCSPNLGTWFQVNMRKFLFAIDVEVLNLMPKHYSCEDFQAIFKGIDASSSVFDADFQKAEFNAKLQFLNAQQQNNGSACTFSSSGTSDWFRTNFGPSGFLALFSDFKRLNPDFDALQVVFDLTPIQLADATTDLNILGAASTPNDSAVAEAKITAIMNALSKQTFSGFQEYVTRFYASATQNNIQSIENEKVRDIMWDTIFDQLTAKMNNFTTQDWKNWFQSWLLFFTPSIKPEQLTKISTSINCLDYQVIVLGLDFVYNEMTQNTQEDVANWMVTFLSKASCDSTDWFIINWRSFRQNTNLSNIMALKPDFDGYKHLDQLNAAQMADLTLMSGALSSVTSINAIFGKLGDLPVSTDLAAYWDRINSSIVQSNKTIDLSKDVSEVMLTKTLEQLRSSMLDFTPQDYKIWTQHRLSLVLGSISSATLKFIPSNIPCESLKEIIAGLNQVYLYIPESNKPDVPNFVVSVLQTTNSRNKLAVDSFCSANMTYENWVIIFFGAFSKQADFPQLNIYRAGAGNPYEILPLLTPEQTGDMMLMSDTLQSILLINNLFDFLDSRPVSYVRACMQQFTTRAKQTSLPYIPQPQVAQLILKRYMLIISAESNEYNATTWKEILDEEAFYVMSVFNETTLQYIVADNCDQLKAIVQGISIRYDYMSLLSIFDVVDWIKSSLNRTKGCMEISPEIWAKSLLGQFVNRVSLLKMQQINPKFKPRMLLSTMTVAQLSEYTVISGALMNVTEVEMVLEELQSRNGPDNYEISLYMSLFYRYCTLHSVTGITDIAVRDKMMSTLFPYVISNLDTMTTDEKNSWFLDKLAWLMPSLVSLNMNLYLQDITCDSFFIIIRGLDNVHLQLSDKENIQAYNFIKSYLNNQLKNTGNACTADITNSNEFLARNLRSFSRAAKITDLESWNKDFNLFDALPRLTSAQIAEATVKSTFIYDTFAEARLLSEMQKRPFSEIDIYITTLSHLLKQKNVKTITNSKVRDFILQTVYQPLQYKLSNFSADDYSDWFMKKLPVLLTSITPEQLDAIPENIDCLTHSVIIQALSNYFDKMTNVQQTAVFQWAHRHLKAKYDNSGSACVTANMNLLEWLLTYYGRSYVLADVEQLKPLHNHFNGFELLTYFTPAQLAQFTVMSGSLENKTDFIHIFEHIQDINGLSIYLDTLNMLSPDLLKNCTFGTDILNGVVSLLSEEIRTFSLDNIVVWFQDRLILLLRNIDASIYKKLLRSADCGFFQAINKALYIVYDDMEPANQANIYEVMKSYLLSKYDRKSGISCKSTTTDSRTWLFTNIGRLSVIASYTDFPRLYRHFNGFVILDIMTLEQLAEFTVQSNSLTNEETLGQIMYYMENRTTSEIYTFVDQLTTSLGETGTTVIANDLIRSKMLLQFVKQVSPDLSEFTVSDWTTFLKKFQLLIPSTNSVVMAFFTPDSCDAFHVIVEGLSNEYRFIPQANRVEICNVIITYLMNQLNITGSPCTVNTTDSRDWFTKSFRKFSVFVPYGNVVQVSQHFNETLVLNDLTMTQLADVAIMYVKQNNVDGIGLVMNAVLSGKPTDAYDFIITFESRAEKENITILPNGIRTAMSFVIFQQVSQLFPTFNDSQWSNTFLRYFRLIIADIDNETINRIPRYMSCTAFQSMVKGLDFGYSDMTSLSKQNVFNMIKDYLSLKKTEVAGTPCPGRDSADWFLNNFASFKELAEYGNFTDLNSNFNGMNAVSILSPRQLAQMCFVTDALQNKATILKILSNVNVEELSTFMDEFNELAKQINMYRLPNTEVEKAMLQAIFYKLKEAFATFSTDDYVLWFQDKIKIMLPSIDESDLENLPSNLTCSCFQVIIKAISDVTPPDGYINDAGLYNFARKFLQMQLQSTGSACTDGITDNLGWLMNNLGVLRKFANFTDLLSVKSDFNGFQTLQVFNSVQMCSLAVRSTAVSNPDDMGTIFNTIQNSRDTEFLASFLDCFNSVLKQTSKELNSNVKDEILLKSLQMIAPQFSLIGYQEMNQWLIRLDGALTSINAAAVQLLPMDMPCENFQAIVKVINNVYSQLTAEQQETVYNFKINYLLSQYNTGGSACDTNTYGSKDWLRANIGQSCSIASASVLSGLSPQFNSTSFTKDCSTI